LSHIKKTPLHQAHLDLGAKMVTFAGYDMPVRYSALTEEHMAVRNSVGVFDVSHMGEFFITGPRAIDLIQRVSSNNATRLAPGQAQYSCMPNESGGIIDDLIIYCIDPERYMLVVNAANIEKDWDWIQRANNDIGAQITDESEEYALLAVQGPKAADLLQPHTDIALADIPYYNFALGPIAGISDVIISATGYTGSGGFELYVRANQATQLWSTLFSKPAVGVLPAGLGARDTLRLEMGYCLYGNDIDDTTSPLEAGLSWITKLDHNFINADFLKLQKEKGVSRRLVGFAMQEKGIPRSGYELLSQDGASIGTVTSGTLSPILEKGIGLGYINVPYHKSDTEILIQIRKKKVPAIVTKTPFI